MDIELLSKMVRELVLDHSSVGLPGVGTFIAEVVPASFSDRGYTINPPYRRLSFVSGYPDDDVLASFYARSNNLSLEESRAILSTYLSQMKMVLKERKTVVMPGLGRLRATRENQFFFVPEEDLDIFPDGMALKPVSLKTHTESAEAVAAAVSELSAIIAATPVPKEEVPAAPIRAAAEASKSAEAPVAAEPPKSAEAPVVPADPSSETQAAPSSETQADPSSETQAAPVAPQPSKPQPLNPEPLKPQLSEPQPSEPETPVAPQTPKLEAPEPEIPDVPAPAPITRHWWFWLLLLTGIVLILFAVYVGVAHIYPGIFDQYLYTPEELDIVRTIVK